MSPTSLIFALLLSSASVARAQIPNSAPRVLTEQVVATYIALNGAKAQAPAGTTSTRFAALDAYFDYDALSAAPFRSHRKAMKVSEATELQKTFRALIMQLTHKAGEKLREGEVAISPARKLADGCAVDFEVSRPEDDITSQVTLVWRAKNKGWQVADVAFDGASVTKDYENQFGRILKKDGAAALLKKLRERLAQSGSAP